MTKTTVTPKEREQLEAAYMHTLSRHRPEIHRNEA